MSASLPVRHLSVAIPLALLLAAAGCAKQTSLLDPNMAGGGGLAGAGGGGGGGGFGLGQASPGSAQEFQVSVGDRVFFETDSSVLTAQARGTLDRQAQWLNQYQQYSFLVEGHADERGTREYNIALGARRAAAVSDYLVSRGVAPQRMRTVSFGKERPVAVCNDISCWSQNRRGVTVLSGASS